MKSKLTHCVPLVSMLLLGGSLLGVDTIRAAASDPSEAFFTDGIIPRLRIELDAAAQASLGQDSRRYVKATVTESNRVYREVGLYLKGFPAIPAVEQVIDRSGILNAQLSSHAGQCPPLEGRPNKISKLMGGGNVSERFS